MAINSGNTWPKKGLKKTNTTLTISILKPIQPGLKKEVFLEKLDKDDYKETILDSVLFVPMLEGKTEKF